MRFLQVIIRKAVERDIPEICTLYELHYQYLAMLQPEYCAAAKESGAHPARVIACSSGDLLVAEAKGEIVGFAHVEACKTPPYPSISPHCYGSLIDLFVREDCRRQGLGRKLVLEAKLWVEKRNLDYLELVVLENNRNAKAFYEKIGFQTASLTMRW